MIFSISAEGLVNTLLITLNIRIIGLDGERRQLNEKSKEGVAIWMEQ